MTANIRITKWAVAVSVCFALILSLFANTNSAEAYSLSKANRVISTGLKYKGKPYVFGARSGITSAFDCSSFTQYIFKRNGIYLPRSSRQQAKMGTWVSKKRLLKGDLIFSDTNRDGVINHVSVFMGNNKILHTYRKGIGVTVSNFKGSIWDRTCVVARRVIR